MPTPIVARLSRSSCLRRNDRSGRSSESSNSRSQSVENDQLLHVGHRHAGRVQPAHQRTHASAGDAVNRDVQFLDRAQYADVGDAASASPAQDEAYPWARVAAAAGATRNAVGGCGARRGWAMAVPQSATNSSHVDLLSAVEIRYRAAAGGTRTHATAIQASHLSRNAPGPPTPRSFERGRLRA